MTPAYPTPPSNAAPCAAEVLSRTPRVGGVWYAGVEVGMVCKYAFAELPRRFMRVCRYRYRASGLLCTA